MDYDYVDHIFIHLHHLPSSPPPGYHHDHHDFQQHNKGDVVERTTAAVVGVSFLGDDDHHDHDEKAVGTLESLVDKATHLVSTSPPVSKTKTYDHGGNIVLVAPSKNHQHHHQFVQVPADNSGVVLTNNKYGSDQIQHRNGKEKELEEIYAVNNEAAKMDNYVVLSSNKYNDGWMAFDSHHDNPFDTSLLTYATTTSSTRSVVPDNHAQSEESKKAEKRSTTSSTNKRSKATILHKKIERKRRYKINQKMEALKRLVPNICYKTDKATILDQVIEYIKKLQNQRDQLMMMSSYGMNNNMTYPMMIPMPPNYMYMEQQQQQQLQMSMLAGAQMGMDADLGGSMHTNPIMHPNMSTTGTSRTPAAIVHPLSIIPSSHNHS